MGGRPFAIVDIERIALQHRHRAHVLAFGRRQLAVGHRRQPDVGIEAELMRGMAGEHRAAARLRDITDQKAGPTVPGGVARQALDQRNHRRMAPPAVAREPHGLPVRAVSGDRDAAAEAALGIEAVGFRRHHRRQRLVAEQVLRQRFRICGMSGRHQSHGNDREDIQYLRELHEAALAKRGKTEPWLPTVSKTLATKSQFGEASDIHFCCRRRPKGFPIKSLRHGGTYHTGNSVPIPMAFRAHDAANPTLRIGRRAMQKASECRDARREVRCIFLVRPAQRCR